MAGAVRREAWVGTYGAVPGIGPKLRRAQLNMVGQQRHGHQPASGTIATPAAATDRRDHSAQDIEPDRIRAASTDVLLALRWLASWNPWARISTPSSRPMCWAMPST
jgi:hypothetical protein